MSPINTNYSLFYEQLKPQFSLIPLDLLQFDESGEKTEEPTEKRKSDARNKGQVPKSQDLTTAITLVFITLFIYSMLYAFYETVGDMFRKSVLMFTVQDMGGQDFWVFFVELCKYWYLMMLPLFAVVIVVTLAAQIGQVGLFFSTEALAPDLNRFNPINGLKKIIGKEALAELVKSLVKLAILSYFPYSLYVNEYPTMTTLFFTPVAASLDYVTWLMVKLILQIGIILLIYGLLDFTWTKYQQNEKLKMTKQEVKEERKQQEGDPQIKQRIRAKQRELAQRAMMGEVPKADVVVTNPVHYAVALKYQSGQDQAPRVVAKGQNLIAHKIKDIARENKVPIIENKPLARALFRQVPLEAEIPEDLFKAVATILAQAYRMRGKAR